MLAAAAQARADGPSPYRFRLEVDVPLLVIGAGLTSIAFLDLPPAACLPDCSPAGVNNFDRTVLGNYSERFHRAADVLVAALLVFPLVLDAVDSREGWLTDTGVFAQAILLTNGLTHLTKVAVRRLAPFVYDPSVPLDVRTNADSTRSFFSGHASTAFAAAAAYTVTFWLRHPKSHWRWVVLGVSAALAATAAVFKVQAGYHFWTDILVGAAVGTSVGTLVPMLHRRE
jgi:membrane-associated phospholipid phosphatase